MAKAVKILHVCRLMYVCVCARLVKTFLVNFQDLCKLMAKAAKILYLCRLMYVCVCKTSSTSCPNDRILE